jgi:hypothetical protein
METVSRASILTKLNKLKAFIERDCGNETINAQRIADRLIKEHDIKPWEFSYVHFTVKARQDAAAERREREQYAQRERERQEETAWRVSFTSCMREVVLALCEKMNLRYTANGGRVHVYCSAANFARFSHLLDKAKRAWSNAVKEVNEAIIEKINNATI